MEKTAKSVWDSCLKFVRDNVEEQVYNTWFRPILPVKLSEAELTIQVPSKFFYEWLEEHYVKLLKSAILRDLGKDAKLRYSIVMANNYDNQKPATINVPSSNRTRPIQQQSFNMPAKQMGEINGIVNPFALPGLRRVKVDSQLNPNYSFDNFVVGESNRLAKSAGNAVSKNPGGTAFNPLFMYGGVGNGKTHLAHAIGVEIKELYPEKTVLFVSAEKFTQQFTEAAYKNNRNDFTNFYQMIDVLIIDDVQFFSSKEKTQNAFFQIFNHLHQKGKQLILTSDKAPVDMQGFENRLLSRFKWGLSAEISVPDYETRLEIIKSKNDLDGTVMPDDVVEFLARNITTNIRELEGALISLLAHASFSREGLNLDLAKKVIKKFVKNSTKEISIDYIQKVVCNYFSMDIDILQSKSRKRNVVQARQLAMFFAKRFTKASLATIGTQIGKRDHATVLHACKTVGNLSETDRQFKIYVEELDKKLSSMH
ncbi:MAG: chromosomal replication initiator protein DnaA [Flavobacteriales bacterium]|nr:chromosomal replication initiator protein DnaA [Flavobacteriales bacterium]